MNWLVLYHVTNLDERRLFYEILDSIRLRKRYINLHIIYIYGKFEEYIHYRFLYSPESITSEVETRDLGEVLSELSPLFSGFIYSGHSSGYLFGKEEQPLISLKDLITSMKVKFKVSIFDCCYMNSLEVIYQLRNFSDYIIASPSYYEDNSILELDTFFKPQSLLLDYLTSMIDEYISNQNKLHEKTLRLSLIDTSQVNKLVNKLKNIRFKFSKETIIHPEDPKLHHLCDILDPNDIHKIANDLKQMIIYSRSCQDCILRGHHNVCIGIYSAIPEHKLAQELDYFFN